jgi:signal transduction histidine kinase
MIYLEITRADKQLIFTNIPVNYRKIFENDKNSKDSECRSIYKKDANEIGFWMVTNNNDLYKSARVAHKSFDIFQEIFIGIHEHYELITLSNTHTIATIQAKMSQQLESLIGASINRRGAYNKVIDDVEIIINKNSAKASEVICALSKRVEEIDTHLKSLSILENKTAVELRSHPLKNMLLNIYSPFKASFNEKKIKVIFERIDENIKIVSDYKIFSLVMHHFFDNAVKY